MTSDLPEWGMMTCRSCKKEHNGAFGTLCEDCWAEVQYDVMAPPGGPGPASEQQRSDRSRHGRQPLEDEGTPASGGGWS